MANQITRDILYQAIEESEELSHHGVLGMQWGKMHGPPYPLRGVDKKIARAEAKRKREKERRLRKLQKAAKKARKEKRKEQERQEDILKKKQKLIKSGDMDKIKKNVNLFTNEELAYINEREEAKREMKTRKERDMDEKLDLVMKRMAQIGQIAASAQQVLGAVKTGSEVVNSFKTARVKDLEAEDKRLGAIEKEFNMRFKGREDSPEAQKFVNAAVNDKKYTPPKEEKKSRLEKKAEKEEQKVIQKQRLLDAKEIANLQEQAEQNAKQAKKDAKQAIKDAKEAAKDEKYAKKQAKEQMAINQQLRQQVERDTTLIKSIEKAANEQKTSEPIKEAVKTESKNVGEQFIKKNVWQSPTDWSQVKINDKSDRVRQRFENSLTEGITLWAAHKANNTQKGKSLYPWTYHSAM